MRFELGRRADYAIRAAVDLARHAAGSRQDPGGDREHDPARAGQNGALAWYGRRRKAREIADEMSIPVSYVPQILAELVRADIAASVAGRDGGYTLARPPAEVSLLEVVQAMDGEEVSSPCVLRGGPCRWDDVCAVHVPWARAQAAMLDALASTTLEELVSIDAALETGTYEVPADLVRPASA